MGSDHLPILLAVPLSLRSFALTKPPSCNVQKAHGDVFAFYLYSHRPSAEEYSFLSLSIAAALFTSLALNATKFSIPFGRVKGQLQALRSPEVEKAVRQKRKALSRYS